MNFASGCSNMIFVSSIRNDFCNWLKLLVQEKQAGNESDVFNQEMVAIVDKLLEYKCITSTQHKKIIKKFNPI